MLKRIGELTAIGLIGEGVVGLMAPERYTASWRLGPAPLREAIDETLAHPTALRSAYATELVAGLLLAAATHYDWR